MTFEATGGSATDKVRDIEVFRARIEPGPSDDELTFEFAIRSGEDRSSVSTGGTIVRDEDGVRHYTFRISRTDDLQDYLYEKSRLASDMAFVDFLYYMAHGMTSAYGSGLGIFQDSYYQVLVSIEALQNFGNRLPDECTQTSDGHLILSYRAVKASPYPPEALFDE